MTSVYYVPVWYLDLAVGLELDVDIAMREHRKPKNLQSRSASLHTVEYDMSCVFLSRDSSSRRLLRQIVTSQLVD